MSALWPAVILSVKIGLLGTLLNLPGALGAVYLLSRRSFRGKSLLEGLINLPLVMPPVTIGYVLLMVFGRRGFIGGPLFDAWGMRIAFTQGAAVLAAMVVSFPLITRSLKTALDMVDPRLEKAAQSLGAPGYAVFFRITLPLVFPGLINGIILGFARSLGEFGATMTFAGNIQGETRTIPLSVYSLLQVPGKEGEAALFVCFSILISLGALFLSSYFQKKHHREGL